MTTKTQTRLYWGITLFFAVAMFFDGIGGVMHAKAGEEVFIHLGYPLYLLTIAGFAKMIGALAILQTRSRTLKEWAYAGFAITCYGAFLSRYFVGDGFLLLVFPIVFLLVTLLSYAVWRNHEARIGG
jgi:hypothetical protein